MNKIFIEAKNNKTSEYHFIKAILNKHFSGKEVDFVCMNGIDNLFKEPILNQISLAQIDGIQTLVLADSDTITKGWGFEKPKEMIINGKSSHNIEFPFFLYLNKKQRDKLCSGDWLFEDPYYWDLNAHALLPLIDFFAKNLK